MSYIPVVHNREASNVLCTLEELGTERASTSMYLLTFRVCVTKLPQYERNGTVHAASASILSPARGVFADMRSARGTACGGSADEQCPRYGRSSLSCTVVPCAAVCSFGDTASY